MLDIKSLSDELDEPNTRKTSPISSQSSSAQPTQKPASGLASNPPKPKRVITQLTEGVRNRNRINVFIDHKFAFSLDIKQVVDLQIKVGQKLSESELQELRSASEFGKLYQRALEWALTRPRSVWETRDYLRRRQLKRAQLNRKRAQEEAKPLPEIQNEAIELVLERLTKRGYVDDYKFAEYFVENRFVKRGISQKRLGIELRKKGVADSIIVKVLNQSKRNDDAELIKIINKKRARYDDEKLINYLLRQGFEYQLIRETLEKLAEAE